MKIHEILLIIGSFIIIGDIFLYLETDIPLFKILSIAFSSLALCLLAALFYYLEKYPENPNGGAE